MLKLVPNPMETALLLRLIFLSENRRAQNRTFHTLKRWRALKQNAKNRLQNLEKVIF